MKTLPLEFLRECLDYDPATGEMTWKNRPRIHFNSDRGWRLFNSRYGGKNAGTVSATTGYLVINFSTGNLYGAHRIAYALHYGEWPEYIDHLDGNRANNSIINLRSCSRSQNQMNRSIQRNNRCGYKGVYKHSEGRWRARIKSGDKMIHLGLFDTPEAAHQAYCVAARAHHREFANFG